ncbi:PD40 domain-containing protein [Candidatus Microgenomates bacterium]|nr:PD40 domain-containing protein [Candidatus Microgenomates bacterium]
MKKKYIFVGIGFVVLFFLIWGAKRQRFTCGDGVCHQKKEFETGICPKDCGANTLSIPDVEDSNQPLECHVKSIEKIGEGSFPKWSPDGNLIAFNKLVDNVYEIFTMKPDGTDITCLTCDRPQLPQYGHKGQPYWHPSGEYLVFSANNTNYKILSDGYAEQPDAGRSHNVWITTKDGDKFWQITDYPENWGVIKPTFSNDGTKIFWNEEFMMEKYPKGKWTDIIRHPGSYWNLLTFIFRWGEELGAWRVVYADLHFDGDVPKIENIKKINPLENFTLLEASGFIANDQGFIYSYADLEKMGGRDLWGDIITSDLEGQNLKYLTFSVYNHDENPEYSPNGKKIAWSSSPGLPGTGGVDIYLMDADGENKVQLTHFGENTSKDYLGDDYSCRELGWSPDGTQIAISFGTNWRPYEKDESYYFDNLYLLTFEGVCGKL